MGLIVALVVRRGAVDLKLTYTAMGCPAMEFIEDDIRERLLAEPEVSRSGSRSSGTRSGRAR